jgi:hypothetical protein
VSYLKGFIDREYYKLPVPSILHSIAADIMGYIPHIEE